MSNNIINLSNAEHEHIPKTLEGEILLDEPDSGGFITASKEVVRFFQNANPAKRAASGWDRYNDILDNPGLATALAHIPLKTEAELFTDVS